jgi:hypothetical protein
MFPVRLTWFFELAQLRRASLALRWPSGLKTSKPSQRELIPTIDTNRGDSATLNQTCYLLQISCLALWNIAESQPERSPTSAPVLSRFTSQVFAGGPRNVEFGPSAMSNPAPCHLC